MVRARSSTGLLPTSGWFCAMCPMVSNASFSASALVSSPVTDACLALQGFKPTNEYKGQVYLVDPPSTNPKLVLGPFLTTPTYLIKLLN